MSVEMTAKVARLAVVCLLLATATASGQEFKTIIGPPNVDLHEGAQLLMAVMLWRSRAVMPARCEALSTRPLHGRESRGCQMRAPDTSCSISPRRP